MLLEYFQKIVHRLNDSMERNVLVEERDKLDNDNFIYYNCMNFVYLLNQNISADSIFPNSVGIGPEKPLFSTSSNTSM